MFTSKKNNNIPKRLHFIWLGSVLREAGKENIKAWREKNPDYEITVWYDSSIFPSPKQEEKFATHKEEFNLFKIWANENNITIKDTTDIYNKMVNYPFYDIAIGGVDANFAEASDITRLEILKLYGGIYLDVEDIFPGQPLGTLKATHGFLCHILLDDGRFNNDIIASTANNLIINDLIQKIKENYTKHYQQGGRRIYAHRSSIFGGFELGLDSRKEMTIALSGPNLIKEIINEVSEFPNSEQLEKMYMEMGMDTIEFLSKKYYYDFAFPKEHCNFPMQQARSWGVSRLIKDDQAFQSHFEYCLLLKYAKEAKSIIKVNYDNYSQPLNILTNMIPMPPLSLSKQLERKLKSIIGVEPIEKDEELSNLLERLHDDEKKLQVFLDAFLLELSEEEKMLVMADFYQSSSTLDDVLEMLRPGWNNQTDFTLR